MAAKPRATLKTTSKAIKKDADDNLSETDIIAKNDFVNAQVGRAKPALAEAIISCFGGWSMFSLYAHDASECGVDAGFNVFSKENDCKAFFIEHKKLLKDFFKTKSGKAKAQNDLLDFPEAVNQTFDQNQIDAMFSRKSKAAETAGEEGDDQDDDTPVSEKDIMVWLARTSAQHIADCYAHLHSDRFSPDPITDSESDAPIR